MHTDNIITLEDGGRKITFGIRLMSAFEMESWLVRVADILPPEQTGPLMANPTALAALILQRGVLALACADREGTAPLLEELLRCCTVMDAQTGAAIPCSSETINEHIGEMRTLLLLRSAALRTNLAFAHQDARKIPTLPRSAAFLRATAEQTYARTANVPQVTAGLISAGMASLHDLRTIYTYADALDLLEVLNVRNYNQWAALEAAKHRKR